MYKLISFRQLEHDLDAVDVLNKNVKKHPPIKTVNTFMRNVMKNLSETYSELPTFESMDDAMIRDLTEKVNQSHLDLKTNISDKLALLSAISQSSEPLKEKYWTLFLTVSALGLPRDMIYENRLEPAYGVYESCEIFLGHNTLKNLKGIFEEEIMLQKLFIDLLYFERKNISVQHLTGQLKEVENVLKKYTVVNHDRLYLMALRCLIAIHAKVGNYEQSNSYQLQFRAYYNKNIAGIERDALDPIIRNEVLLTAQQVTSIVFNQLNSVDEIDEDKVRFIESFHEDISPLVDEFSLNNAQILLMHARVQTKKGNLIQAFEDLDTVEKILQNFNGIEYNNISITFHLFKAYLYFKQAEHIDEDKQKEYFLATSSQFYAKALSLHAQTPQLVNVENVVMKQQQSFEELGIVRQRLTLIEDTTVSGEEEAEASSTTGATTLGQLAVLSKFSSEVQHQAVAHENRILTVEEFETLGNTGSINPFRLRWAQAGINNSFSDKSPIQDLVNILVADPTYTQKIDPVCIGVYAGKVWSFDTRRLAVHMMAKELNPAVTIRFKKITGVELAERIRTIHSEHPWNGLVTAVRFGGKGSESTPYINPSVRSQLDEVVPKSFVGFPSQRVAGECDPNGYKALKKEAEKIHAFLRIRQANGSKLSDILIQEAMNIGRADGSQAAYQYLVSTKEAVLSGTFVNPTKRGLVPIATAQAD